MLIDRPEIVYWRRNYLPTIKQSREENSLDETCVNVGNTVLKV